MSERERGCLCVEPTSRRPLSGPATSNTACHVVGHHWEMIRADCALYSACSLPLMIVVMSMGYANAINPINANGIRGALLSAVGGRPCKRPRWKPSEGLCHHSLHTSRPRPGHSSPDYQGRLQPDYHGRGQRGYSKPFTSCHCGM